MSLMSIPHFKRQFNSISIDSGRVAVVTGAETGILIDSVIILNKYLINN